MPLFLSQGLQAVASVGVRTAGEPDQKDTSPALHSWMSAAPILFLASSTVAAAL